MPDSQYDKGAKSIRKAFRGDEKKKSVWDKIKDFGSYAMRGESLRDSLKKKKKQDEGK